MRIALAEHISHRIFLLLKHVQYESILFNRKVTQSATQSNAEKDYFAPLCG